MTAIVLAVLCALWLVQAILVVIHLREMVTLSEESPSEPDRWPSVSAIVPARDEEASIDAALRTRLADPYPRLEVVVVDDRSADATPDVISQLAAEDPRVVPVHVDELPAGWLGKINALERGRQAASGEWLLFSDADVHFEPGVLGSAVALCEERGLDLLALIPEFRSPSFMVNVVWSVFIRAFVLGVSPAAVRNVRSKVGAGSGSFMLVRRSSFDASPGFGELRMETGDDMALGVMLKRSGARCEIMNGRGAAWLPSYADYGTFLRGIEKNGATVATVPFVVFLCAMIAVAAVELSPLLAIVVAMVSSTSWLLALGVVTFAVATATNIYCLYDSTGTVVPAFLWPFGWLAMAYGLVRSAWLTHRRGGVMWRDTFYSLEELHEGRRFRLL
ncbi:MAG TPA: glycosyltransferase family 2 protein [Coriobacteriia bacterium]|nr:glycosyltransferase family 2 protein [Coriobacteriia bacterium]